MQLSFLTIFLTAASLLGYEILLMRLLSILNWSHYAYMVVSLAMLGLGVSGVILALFPKSFNRRREDIILLGCFLASFTIPLTFFLNQKLPLNFLYLIWDWRQFIYLGINYLVYGFPFIIMSTILAIFFLQYPQKTGQVYAMNLLGSGSGVILAVGLMYIIPPEKYLTVIAVLAASAGFFWGIRSASRPRRILVILFFIITVFAHMLYSSQSLLAHISEYKGLSGLLRLPNTKIVRRAYSPLGLIHIAEGNSIRLAPGLSINSRERLPIQKALTIDAGSPSPILSSFKDFKDLRYLDEMIFSAGYHLHKNPQSLIVGAGGGTDVLLARYHQAKSVTVLEMNPKIIKSTEDILGDSFHRLYQKPDVRLIIKEARGFLEATKDKYDLIQLNPIGTLTSSASGVYAQNEDYLNTVEAYQLFYRTLSPDGIFMTSRWLKMPARDGLKLFSTGVEILNHSGVEHPEEHLALIRNWDIIMLLIKRTPFTSNELQTLREFCINRNFDVEYLPGIKKSEVNRFNKLPEPVYYTSALSMLNEHKKNEFYATYPFNIKPATDDKPYFSNFFRWAALPHLIRTLGKEWLPFSEYGYLVQLTTFVQAVIAGGLIILLPMGLVLKKRKTSETSFKPSMWYYFMLLGMSYMFLEMTLIQKFILFLHHPIYSASVVITSFLLLSGAGSLLSHRFSQKSLGIQILPFTAIVILGVFYTFTLNAVFAHFSWADIHLRLLISFLIIAPIAFFMGMPFPFGMQKVVVTGEKNTGAAWGYNGFFSVIGAVAAPILAGLVGFRMVTITGCLGYLAAMIIWIKGAK